MLADTGLVLAGLVMLIWGADRFVLGASATARNLGVAPLLIGLTIVGFATSAPEVLVSVVASLGGSPTLAIGNAIGSNIANIGLVLGGAALIKPIEIKSETLRREMPALLAVTLLTLSLFLDSYMSRIDGFILLTALFLVMYWIVRLGFKSSATDPIQAEYAAEIPEHMAMRVTVMWLIVGLTALLIGAELMVSGAISLAETFAVPELVIGITLVALATSLPELAVSITAALKGEHGLAIGNIIGSNIFNLLAVIGVAVVIAPTPVAPIVLSLHIFVMVGFTLVLFAMAYNYSGEGRINRLEAGCLLLAFIAYDIYVVLRNM